MLKRLRRYICVAGVGDRLCGASLPSHGGPYRRI
jgi:hypothetical protein